MFSLFGNMSTKLAVNWVFNAYDYRTKRSLHKICRWRQLLIHWTFCPGIVGFPFVKFENVKKQFVFQEQPEQLCTCLTLFGTFLCCSLHSNGVQVFYGGRELKTTNFAFFLNLKNVRKSSSWLFRTSRLHFTN